MRARKARDGSYRIRCLILLRLDAGATPASIAREFLVARSTISRVRSRFLTQVIAALTALLRRYWRYRRLHFLPPYAPKYSRIEQVWKQVHDNVTRNHRCASIDQLVEEVDSCLQALSAYPG
ncbi:transposase [Sorangium sp. So ce1182]|uniref:transposase n=1 Tax=Sorangium sp. So ce1182 TaxID=3133334 RepID=UPI003F5DF585